MYITGENSAMNDSFSSEIPFIVCVQTMIFASAYLEDGDAGLKKAAKPKEQ